MYSFEYCSDISIVLSPILTCPFATRCGIYHILYNRDDC